ncbi:MAG: energy-coupling factor transporter ATPase [Lachnospiraceae bacterium]|nr:energy-coupling factor transporter ATPase [Lachnospiraceae bacterium]
MLLRFDHVNCIYDPDASEPVHALTDVSLSVGGGEFVGLIGHTGSGKSTLVQHMNGLLRPTSGTVFADDTDIWSDRYDRKALRARVGLVFQYPEHQLFETDVLADVCFGPRNLGRSREDAERDAKEALSMVGIEEALFSQSPFDLSGGQKRRVAIAGVLAMHPEILILDEPTAGLDPRRREEILSLISELHETQHISIVLVSHSMEDVARYADRILVMDNGKVLYDDPPAAVFARHRELAAIGLRAPEAALLLSELSEAGLSGFDTYAVSAEDTAKEILQAMHSPQGVAADREGAV